MRTWRWAAVLAAAGAIAPAQSECLRADQVGTLVSFALPPAISAVVHRCRAVLPNTSYVARAGDALIARTRTAAMSHADMLAVRDAIQAMTGDRVPDGLGDDTLTAMASDMITSKLGKVTTDQCRIVDSTLELLDPLPPQNLARLVVQLMRLGAKSDPHVRLCPDPATRP